MLVVNNGAPKSGSTWVQKMLKRIVPHSRLRKTWRRDDWETPSIHPMRLRRFFEQTDIASDTYLIKAHYDPKVAGVLVRDHVLIINSARSIPDLVLSYFHHQKRLGKTDLTLATWIDQYGLEVAHGSLSYLRGWKPYAPTMHFELMYADPEASAMELARIVRSPLSEDEIRAAGRETQNTPREGVREGHHVRTGKPGASREELDPAAYEQLKAFDEKLLALFPERATIPARA